MNKKNFTRRDFLKGTAVLATTVWFPPQLKAAQAPKRTAVDLVSLGKSGLKISRMEALGLLAFYAFFAASQFFDLPSIERVLGF